LGMGRWVMWVGDGRGFTQRRGGRRGAFPTTSCWSRRRAEHNSVQHPSCHHRPKGRETKRTLEPQACLHKQVQGDENIRLRTPIPQHCHSRESGNPWSDMSARDTFLVRTKTRRPGATSLCLRAFVRTILPIVRPMDSRFRGNDTLRGSRRGAEVAEAHFPATSCWSRRRAEHKKVQGEGNIRLRTPIPQHCHSRESGNPWSDISARDTFLVRTKTRRRGATSLCLRAFVRTILPIVRPMGSRFRGNDTLRESRRSAEVAEECRPHNQPAQVRRI
jgi:hypothetical protein